MMGPRPGGTHLPPAESASAPLIVPTEEALTGGQYPHDIFVPIAEAAFIAGVSDRDMNRTVDEHILPDPLTRSEDDRLFARLGAALAGFYFTAEDVYAAGLRRRVVEEVATKVHARKNTSSILALHPESIRQVDWKVSVPGMSIGTIAVDVSSFVERAVIRIESIEKANALIVKDPMILGGLPTFKGTRVPVDVVVGSLKEGASPERILSAYSSLTDAHLKAARIYADVYPKRGRPAKASAIPRKWKIKSVEVIKPSAKK